MPAVRSRDAIPPSEGSVIGTPLDYSENLYRFYLEIVDVDGTAERVLASFLGPRHTKRLRRLAHGFEFVASNRLVGAFEGVFYVLGDVLLDLYGVDRSRASQIGPRLPEIVVQASSGAVAQCNHDLLPLLD